VKNLGVENVGVCIWDKVQLENNLSQSEGRLDWVLRVRVHKQAGEYHNQCDMFIYRQNTSVFISSTIWYTVH
jgi:hypothetical protein